MKTTVKFPKQESPHPEWAGLAALRGDVEMPSASTLASRMPDDQRLNWQLGNKLTELARDDELRESVLGLALSGNPGFAAEKLEPYTYGPRDENGHTPSERGTGAHDFVEQVLLGQVQKPNVTETDRVIGKEILKALENARLDPLLVEEAIYNPDMRVAGRVDLIGKLNGEIAIIDFKSKSKKPRKYYGTKHYVQLATYSQCTHLATWERVRVLSDGGRRYLVSPEEHRLAQKLPVADVGYLIEAWPGGHQLFRHDLRGSGSVVQMCSDFYALSVFNQGKQAPWKRIKK